MYAADAICPYVVVPPNATKRACVDIENKADILAI